jgi:NitT/TauT family transport system substrate-binding protein
MPDHAEQDDRRRPSRRSVLVTGALALAGAGCSSGPAPARSALEKPDLVVGAIQAVTAAGLYVAQQQSFFAREGLRVTILPTTGSGPVMADLLNGRIDINFGNYVPFIAAEASGAARLRILAEGNDATAREEQILVLPQSPITSVAGLRGKVIGVNALQGVATLIVSSVLTEHRVPLSSVRFTAIPYPSMAAALAAHRVDAAWMVDPFLSEAQVTYGAVSVADGYQGATAGFPIAGFAVTDAWANRYPATAAAFVRALDRGQRLANTSRSTVEAVLERYIGISPHIAALAVTGSFPVGVSQAKMQRVADIMHQFGYLKQPFSVSPMIS